MVTKFGYEIAIGSSGTIVNLMQVARAVEGEPPLRQISGATLTSAGLSKVVDLLLACGSVDERAAIDELDPKRADIVVGGALVLDEAFKVLGIDEMVVSDFALREGVLLDALRRRDQTSIGHLRDLRYESVMHVAALVPSETDHAERSTELALRMFEQLHGAHHLDAAYEEILEAAGFMANVGLLVSHDRHHLHSYYVIRNSDLLTGFTDEEIELIAQVARYHRKSAPKSSHSEFAALSPDAQHVVKVLAGILRIGIALDRTRTGSVRDVDVEVGDHQITIVPEGDGDMTLERYTADSRRALLEDALGVEVVIA
jgi:exopolyphosphatase/guanosine-5'-triphosphate,3'-diphosphate pyrophosphatase